MKTRSAKKRSRKSKKLAIALVALITLLLVIYFLIAANLFVVSNREFNSKEPFELYKSHISGEAQMLIFKVNEQDTNFISIKVGQQELLEKQQEAQRGFKLFIFEKSISPGDSVEVEAVSGSVTVKRSFRADSGPLFFIKQDFSKDTNNAMGGNSFYPQANGVLDTNKRLTQRFFGIPYVYEVELQTHFPLAEPQYEACVSAQIKKIKKDCVKSPFYYECVGLFMEDINSTCAPFSANPWQTSKVIFDYIDGQNYFYAILMNDTAGLEISKVQDGAYSYRVFFALTDANIYAWNNYKIAVFNDEILAFVNDKFVGSYSEYKSGFFEYKNKFFGGKMGGVGVECADCSSKIRKLNVYGLAEGVQLDQ